MPWCYSSKISGKSIKATITSWFGGLALTAMSMLYLAPLINIKCLMIVIAKVNYNFTFSSKTKDAYTSESQ